MEQMERQGNEHNKMGISQGSQSAVVPNSK